MFAGMPVTEPSTPYDYVALRDEYQKQLDALPLEFIAKLYGVSAMEDFRDDDFLRLVHARLAQLPDPRRARFDFAYHLGAEFWDAYSCWNYDQPDQPEYVGDVPDTLVQTTMDWLLEGIQAHKNDRELMQNVHWLKYRWMAGDTFLDEHHIQILEAALGYTIQPDHDPYVIAAFKRLEELRDMFEDKYGASNESDGPEAMTNDAD